MNTYRPGAHLQGHRNTAESFGLDDQSEVHHRLRLRRARGALRSSTSRLMTTTHPPSCCRALRGVTVLHNSLNTYVANLLQSSPSYPHHLNPRPHTFICACSLPPISDCPSASPQSQTTARFQLSSDLRPTITSTQTHDTPPSSPPPRSSYTSESHPHNSNAPLASLECWHHYTNCPLSPVAYH